MNGFMRVILENGWEKLKQNKLPVCEDGLENEGISSHHLLDGFVLAFMAAAHGIFSLEES